MDMDLRREFEKSRPFPQIWDRECEIAYIGWLEQFIYFLRSALERMKKERNEIVIYLLRKYWPMGTEEQYAKILQNYPCTMKLEEIKDLDPKIKECVNKHFDELINSTEQKEEKNNDNANTK